jgi:hypothetical protein
VIYSNGEHSLQTQFYMEMQLLEPVYITNTYLRCRVYYLRCRMYYLRCCVFYLRCRVFYLRCRVFYLRCCVTNSTNHFYASYQLLSFLSNRTLVLHLLEA